MSALTLVFPGVSVGRIPYTRTHGKGLNLRIFRIALRQAWRDTRAGDLRLLGLAVIVAVAAVTSVGFLSDRVSRALERDAAQMLGADLVLEADTPVPPEFLQQAREAGLVTATTWQFPSMVGTGTALQLASVKAVEAGYPLRGGLRTTTAVSAPDAPTSGGPGIGEAWVDPRILAVAGLNVGDPLKVGDVALRIARVITFEPDRGTQFVNLAPRVMIRAEDLPATGLVSTGSRIGYAMLAAGPMPQVEALRVWLETHIKPGQKLVTIESGRPEIRRSLDRAQQFLSLVAMLAVLIAAVAVALAARRFGQRHRASIAVMRCLGATQGVVTRILTIEFLLVGLVASVVGTVIGWGGHAAMVRALGAFLGSDLPPASYMPALQGLFTGIWVLVAFALPPLQALRRVAPSQILRQESAGVPLQSVAGYAIGVTGFTLLMWWVAHDLKLGGGLALGFVAAVIVFGVASALALWALGRFRGLVTHSPVLRFALAGLVRRRSATIAQVCALAIGMMAILLLTIVRTDLLSGWQRTLPPDAPNRFLINVQPDQREAVGLALARAGIEAVRMSPMVRGRLVARNGTAVSAADYDEPRAQRLIEREFNLSYADRLAQPEQISAGADFDGASDEVSLETGLAKSLRLELGDLLEFDVAGEPVRVRVTSLRRVDWDSMRANFFAILSTRALEGRALTFMTAVHVRPDQAGAIQALVGEFPNITVFDVGAILAQLQTILDKVGVAVQGLFVFSVLAGIIVLASALSATRDERVREAALMRALGATRRQLARAQRIELLGVGALAGLLAAGGATIAAWALSRWVFEFGATFSPWPWLLGLGVCMLGAWAAGALALRGVLQTPPLTVLRNV